MSKLFAATVLGLGMSLGVAAQEVPAANVTLSDIDGRVSVNEGQGFAPGREGMRLKPGDRVMIQEGSDVTLTFDDECRLEVSENKIVTIPDRSTCAGAVLAEQGLAPEGGSAIGSTGRGNGGVWAMVAIVAAIDIWWLNEDDDDTASP